MELRTGDILLVDTEGFIPSKIDKFQGNDFNHAGFIINVFGINYVFEAINSGIAFTSFNDYQKRLKSEDINLLILRSKENIWKEIPIDDLMNFCMPLTTGFYAFRNLLFFQAVKYLWKKVFRKEKWIGQSQEEIIENGNYICGQLVMRIYNNFFGWYQSNWHKGAPVDLFNDIRFNQLEYNGK